MGVTSDGDDATIDENGRTRTEGKRVRLRAHTTTPQRTVFIEPDNNDGWISTDMTVDVRR